MWLATRFFALPNDDSPRAPPPGPEGCPFGLVATEISVEPVGAVPATKSGELWQRRRWRLEWTPRGLERVPDVPHDSPRPRFRYRVAGGVSAMVTARHSLEYAREVLGIPPDDQESVVLARSGTGSVVAWIAEDLAHVAWLDRGGTTAGPFTLPASIGHALGGEVAVVDRDGLAAVAWSDGRSDGWSAAVVDRSGRSSASLAQPRGERLALGVVGRDFVAADLQWGRDRPRALRLDCRTEAPFGAPEVLAIE